jgi:hypothetical protein
MQPVPDRFPQQSSDTVIIVGLRQGIGGDRLELVCQELIQQILLQTRGANNLSPYSSANTEIADTSP